MQNGAGGGSEPYCCLPDKSQAAARKHAKIPNAAFLGWEKAIWHIIPQYFGQPPHFFAESMTHVNVFVYFMPYTDYQSHGENFSNWHLRPVFAGEISWFSLVSRFELLRWPATPAIKSELGIRVLL